MRLQANYLRKPSRERATLLYKDKRKRREGRPGDILAGARGQGVPGAGMAEEPLTLDYGSLPVPSLLSVVSPQNFHQICYKDSLCPSYGGRDGKWAVWGMRRCVWTRSSKHSRKHRSEARASMD